MSALELDGCEDPSSVSYYAPRRRRTATNEPSIRPILAKLRREHGAYPLVESVPLMPSDELIGAFDGAGPRKRALLIAARFVAVTGLCAGAAVAAYSLQAQPREEPEPQREDRAALPATALPRTVQTVSFKSQARIGDAALSAEGAPMSTAETSGQPRRDSAEPAADGRRTENTAVLPSLQTPSVPASLSAAGWSPAAKDAFGEAEPAEKTQAPAKEQKPEERHVAHSRRPHHVRHRHHVARASTPPQPAADTAPAQPGQVTLTDLLRKIFKSDRTDQMDKADTGAIR